MSILMAIKYPVSFPPKPGELEALPTKVFDKWVHSIKFTYTHRIHFGYTKTEDIRMFYEELYWFFTKHGDDEGRLVMLKGQIDTLKVLIYNLDE